MKRFFLTALTFLYFIAAQAEIKYIFYFIGDGMGPNQVLTTEMYQAELQGKLGRVPLCMTQFPHAGMLATYSASNGVTDSSAAGTALACGEKANNSALGINALGDTLISTAEVLHQKGWAIGVTTSVSIDHATPASFYAKSSSRNDYYHIGLQLVNSNFDFFGGSAFKHPQDRSRKEKSLYAIARENGYTLAHGYNEYQTLKADAQKMILVNYNEALTDEQRGPGMIPYAIDKTSQDITLPQITTAAIDFLQNKERFFLMTEGGAIDWAGHADDGATMIKEVQEFDQSIQVAYNFYLQHPDETLIIVTADHETEGLIIGNGKYVTNLQVLQNQKVSVGVLSDQIADLHKKHGKNLQWENLKQLLQTHLGFYDKVDISSDENEELQEIFKESIKGNTQDVKTLYKELGKLANEAIKILNDKSILSWASGSHSATPVPLFAIGKGAEIFSGWHDNTEIKGLILQTINQ